VLAGEQIAGAAEPCLRLVKDQQHAALAALGRQGRHVADGRLQHAAGAQDRLGDTRSQLARRLAVDQFEAKV
jgi:hypothetical protein